MDLVLIVTGDLEKIALGASLRRIFPDLALLYAQKLNSFTSTRIVEAADPRPSGARPLAELIADAMLAAHDPGRRQRKPDLVIVCEDLELANDDQPEVVVDCFRNAVQAVLEQRLAEMNMRSRNRLEAAVRERSSFHLFAPMPESSFFGEPDALVRAGASAHPSRFDATQIDFEDFNVEDPDFAASERGNHPRFSEHPKRYIEFLSDETYAETAGGVAALRVLDWERVLENEHFGKFARSLFADIADALGEDEPFPGDLAAETARRPNGELRNI